MLPSSINHHAGWPGGYKSFRHEKYLCATDLLQSGAAGVLPAAAIAMNIHNTTRKGAHMYPTINMKATAIRLRQIMKQQKITAKDIQKYLNLSCVQSVYHWLSGRNLPTIDNLYALSGLFQMPMDDLVVGNRKRRMSVFEQAFYDRMFAYYEGFMEMGTA